MSLSLQNRPNARPTLRPYQIQAETELRQKFASRIRRVILCMPTGAGKTMTFASICSATVEKGNRVLILTDRTELLEQGAGALARFALKPSLISAGNKEVIKHRVYVGMVETINRRIQKYGDEFIKSLGYIDLIIVDEAHKASFYKVLESFPDAFVIGATATPLSANKSKPLNLYFQDIVDPVSISELIEDGFLCPAKLYSAPADFGRLNVRAGEYTDESQMFYFDKKVMYENVVRHYKQHAEGLKTLVFCVNILHAEQTAETFRMAGYTCECVTNYTPDAKKRYVLDRFKSGAIQILVNVGKLTTGYDEPSIQCVILNRKTKSLPLFLQMCGRGSRLYPNKDHFVIIDMGLNWQDHGFWQAERDWTEIFTTAQIRTAGEGEASLKTCKVCYAVNYSSVRRCVSCGQEFESKSVEYVDGDLVEIDDIPNELYQLYEQASNKQWSQLSLMELHAVRKVKGYKLGWATRLLRQFHPPDAMYEYAKIAGYKRAWAARQLQNSY